VTIPVNVGVNEIVLLAEPELLSTAIEVPGTGAPSGTRQRNASRLGRNDPDVRVTVTETGTPDVTEKYHQSSPSPHPDTFPVLPVIMHPGS